MKEALKRAVLKCLIFAALALAGAPHPARAQLACSLNVSPVQFDSISGTSAGTFDARGTITVSCSGSQGAAIAACIEIGEGASSASGRRLLSPPKRTAPLPLQIFQDTALTRVWGTSAMNQSVVMQRTGDGPMSATAYLRAYVQKGALIPGTYSAQFPVTLNYGAVTGSFVECNALRAAAAWRQPPGPRPTAAVPALLRKR